MVTGMDATDVITAHARRIGELESELIIARLQIRELQALLARTDTPPQEPPT